MAEHSRWRTRLLLYGQGSEAPIVINAYCLRQLGIRTPAAPLEPEVVRDWQALGLADRDFGTPSGINLLIGANAYGQLLLPQQKTKGELVAQLTKVGWILTGRAPGQPPSYSTFTCSTFLNDDEPQWHSALLSMMRRFWETEDLLPVSRRSRLMEECEASFTDRHRTLEGRYVVRLPIKAGGLDLLGESLPGAQAALRYLHRRFSQDSELAAAYVAFMEEYERLGHMKALTREELASTTQRVNYIPHHGIWQRKDLDRRLRVVFNASKPTSTGSSLNDVLLAGPNLQAHLASVLTRWRRHRVAFCADIKMMFRQIRVDERDIDLQRILWSSAENVPPVHYQLLTVTYGQTCSPFLSLRVLQQLCADSEATSPAAQEAVMRDRYADDILTGSADVESSRRLRDELIRMLAAGGFPLKKWVSNEPRLLQDLPEGDRLRPTWWQLSSEGPVNELGVNWDPTADCFRLTAPEVALQRHTKRGVLAAIARCFDPCGWLAPILLVAKLLLQDLWRAKLNWDEPLTTGLIRRWDTFATDLKSINNLTIPRWIRCQPGSNLQLHAFADASQRAMAAAVYARVHSDSATHTHLLIARTKLTPIRSLRPSRTAEPRSTIPRLELRAALLATKLLHSLATELEVPFESCYAWSDSQIALHWITSTEPSGNGLVDNYVGHIHELAPSSIWHYVPSTTNSADIASRGSTTLNLASNSLWWTGPDWLGAPSSAWPRWTNDSEYVPEGASLRTTCCVIAGTAHDFFDKFSDLPRLLRFMSRLRRWIRLRRQGAPKEAVLNPVSAEDLSEFYRACVRYSQLQDFSSELHVLRSGRELAARNPLRRLGAFLDNNDIIRVGGRLDDSSLPFEEKHPPILDGRSHLAALVISWAHQRALHGGFRVTFAYILKKAWLIGGRRRVKTHIRRCVICVRASARPMTQMMAALPRVRVTPGRAFLRAGVDYAGPFNVLPSKGRGRRTVKAYIVVFVCLATKALHLELAGDLTTESFLGAFTRFYGRRGKPAEMWSDNATYFHGADRELQNAVLQAQLDWDVITGALADQGVSWKYIPPGAPHFGGLWEAGVKSVKRHLKRVVGPRKLTYEEFSTFLVSVEMVLNSRPLTPITGEPEDIEALTPGHFLVDGSLASIPHPMTVEPNLDQLSHWRLVRGLRDMFWTRWGREYLNTLQQRQKWTGQRPNIKNGDLVVVLDPSLMQASGRWPLARVVATHPGQDGLVRVATVRTATGEYRRPIVKLALLPVSTQSMDQTAAAPDNSAHGGRDS